MRNISNALLGILAILLIPISSIIYFSIPKKDYQYFINHPDEAFSFSNKCHSNLLENLRDADHDDADDIRHDSECLSARSVALELKVNQDKKFIANKKSLIEEQKLKEGIAWEKRYQSNLVKIESMTWNDFLVVKNECLSKPMDSRDFAICSAVDHLYNIKMQTQLDYVKGMSSKKILKYYHDSCESEFSKSKDSCYLLANIFNNLKQEAMVIYSNNRTILEDENRICNSSQQKQKIFNDKVTVDKEGKLLFCELIAQSFSVAFATVMESSKGMN